MTVTIGLGKTYANMTAIAINNKKVFSSIYITTPTDFSLSV